MRNILTIVVFLLCFSSHAVGFERHEIEFSVPVKYGVEAYKTDLQNWVSSLVKGLGYDSSKIATYVFLKTDISIRADGKIVEGAIYQNKDKPTQFYVSKPKAAIVDFSAGKVGTMGVSGISTHPTPSGRMVVVLSPQKGTNILGVTLDFTFKTQVKEPKFSSNSVHYEW
ncbi:MAG: hypothetical protein C0625_13240 [Arcobacter sp.]|nr:MAG: hypothetical protein C0625_13240 [Arcobacter sp.]